MNPKYVSLILYSGVRSNFLHEIILHFHDFHNMLFQGLILIVSVIFHAPQVWKYQETDRVGDGALEQISTGINTSDGQSPKDLLLTGGVNGYLRYC